MENKGKRKEEIKRNGGQNELEKKVNKKKKNKAM
jgi:hypothetical protein